MTQLKPPAGFALDTPDDSPPSGFQLDRPAQAAPAPVPLQRPSEDGDFMRGFKRTLPEAKQLIGGSIAAVGDVLDAEGMRDYGLKLYREQEDVLQPLQRPTDSASEAWEQVKQGNLGAGVDFLQNAAGYTAGQAVESLAAAGAGALVGGAVGGAATAPVGGEGALLGAPVGAIGGFVAKQALKRTVKQQAEKLVAAQIERGVAKEVAKKAGADYIAANAAKDVLAKQVGEQFTKQQLGTLGGRTLGAAAGAQAMNLTMELGSIYPEALRQAQEEGRVLTGEEQLKAFGAAFGAAGLESAADLFNLGVLMRGTKGAARDAAQTGLKAAAKAYAGRAALAGTEGALREAGTEAAQTGLERYGAGQSLTDAEAMRDYIDSAAVGAVGGALFGGAAALHPRKDTAQAPDFGKDELDSLRADVVEAQASGDAALVETASANLATALHQSGRVQAPEPAPVPQAPVGTLARVAEHVAVQSAPVEAPQGSLSAVGERVAGIAARTAMRDAMQPPTPEMVANADQAELDLATLPAGMDPATGEIPAPTPVDRGAVLDYLMVQGRNTRMPGVNQLVKVFGLGETEARALRKQALAQLTTESTPPITATPEQGDGREGAADLGGSPVDVLGEPGAGEGGENLAGSEVARDDGALQASPESDTGDRNDPGESDRAIPRAAAVDQAPGGGLSYDESEEQQDGDITPPSGSPFTIRDAAEREAARHEGGRVFDVDGGFVVRVPRRNEPEAAQSDLQPRMAEADGIATPVLPSPSENPAPRKSSQTQPADLEPAQTAGQPLPQDAAQPSVPPASSVPPETAPAPAAGQASAVDEAAIRAEYAAAMQAKSPAPNFDYSKSEFATQIVRALQRDPAAIEWVRDNAANGLNAATLNVFAKHAGIKMPKSQKGQKAAIDAWAGIAPEQRADSDAKIAQAQADGKAKRVAEQRARQPIPDFTNYAEAHAWAKRRAGAFQSEGQYRTTEEYRDYLVKARPLYEKALEQQQAQAKSETDAAGVKAGDHVKTSQIGAFLTAETWTGMVFLKNGMPWVRIDNGGTIPVSKKGKVTQARAVRWDSRWAKVEQAESAQPAAPTQAEPAKAVESTSAVDASKNPKSIDKTHAASLSEQAAAVREAAEKALPGTKGKDRLKKEARDLDRRAKVAANASDHALSIGRDGYLQGFSGQPYDAMTESDVRRMVELGFGDLQDYGTQGSLTRKADGRQETIAIRPELIAVAREVIGSAPKEADKPAAGKDAGQSAKEKAKTDSIEDFGEVLSGARKHYAAEYADRARDATELDLAKEPLSKTWPEPDYDKLLEGGADPFVVAWVHAARDEIPNRPRQSWKLKGWVAKTQLLREVSLKLLRGDITAETLHRAMGSDMTSIGLQMTVGGRTELYQAVGHGTSLKGVRFGHHNYTLYRGQKDVSLWVVERDSKATAYSNWPQELATGKTKEEAIANFKVAQEKANAAESEAKAVERGEKLPKFVIYSRRFQEGFIIGVKIRSNAIDLKRFATAKEARAYLSENKQALAEQFNKLRTIPFERGRFNAPRVGVDHRSGADVTPERFADAFGFRGVQFGNYVEGPRRQQDMNNAYDALMDLAGVLDIPPRALSLNGTLGLAFGARGTGGTRAAAAHFEPDTVVINLTKGAGAGSLAHEWFHSLDNYFSRLRGIKHGFATVDQAKPHEGVRPEMTQAFTRILNTITKETELQKRSSKLDTYRTKDYWSTKLEMAARAFESYVIAKLADQNGSNDYLANIVSETAFDREGEYPYPTAAEIPAIRAAFDEFFDTVQTREQDNGNVALFRRREDKEARRGLDVDATVADLTKAWENAPKVEIVDTANDLPADIQAEFRRYGSDGNDVRGAYHAKSGAIYVVRRNVRSRRDLEATLFHEAYGHHGLRLVFGKDMDRQLQRLLNAVGGIGGLKRYARQHDIDLSAYDAILRRPGMSREVQGEILFDELFAHMAERIDTLPKTLGQKVAEFIGAIRSWLRRNGFTTLAGNLTDGEVAALLQRSRRAVEGDTRAMAPDVADAVRLSKTQAPGAFYSALAESVEQAKGAPKKADAATWRGWLDGAQRRGEFRQSERDWLGIDDFLAKNGTTTREQLADFIRANQVQVRDVVLSDAKGEVSDALNLWMGDNLEDAPESGDDWMEVADRLGELAQQADTAAERERYEQLAREADQHAAQYDGGVLIGGARFANYQLPGGENYRELLLTLPAAPKPEKQAAADYYETFIRRGGEPSWDDLPVSERAQIAAHMPKEAKNAPANAEFRSSHFDQPNILAHVRFNERTDADGKRVLFLEEIQSDWHQQGRKRGYGKKWVVRYGNAQSDAPAGVFATEEEARAKAAELNAQIPYDNYGYDVTQEVGTPDAPFKATDEWAMLAFKRMVRWAAEHGFDRIAWTTGEQQAERYDLSKQVLSIQAYGFTDAGERSVMVELGGNSPRSFTEFRVDRAGVVIDTTGAGIQGAEGKSLDEVIGKEIAEKVMALESGGKIEGDGLKVGGEGMRAFYDKILPSAVNKWAKRFGGKAGETTIDTQGSGLLTQHIYEGPTRTASFVRGRLADDSISASVQRELRDVASAMERGQSFANATAGISPSAADALGGEMVARNSVDTTVHALDLTPAMRDAALAGQPLFRLDPSEPRFRQWFKQSKVVNADGTPKVVYHGTASEFWEFDTAKLSGSTGHMSAPLGFFFAENQSQAERYARHAADNVPADERVLDVYLSIQNPKSMTLDELLAIDDYEEARALRAKLKKQGYDGIFMPELKHWIAFAPNQIKSASENNGNFDVRDPDIRFSMRAPTEALADIEAVMTAGEDRSVIEKAKAKLADLTPSKVKDALRGTWLGALATSHLTELGSDYFANIKHYSDFLGEMGADRNQLQQEGEEMAEPWRQWAAKHPEAQKALASVMHDATIDGVDPSTDYTPLQFRYGGKLWEVNKKNVKDAIAAIKQQMRERSGDSKKNMIEEAKGLRAMLNAEQRRVKQYPELERRYAALPAEAKAFFAQVRDAYLARSKMVEDGLVQRIEDTDAPEHHKRKLITTIRQQFEQHRLQGVYFPLQRHGQYFVSAEKGDATTFLMTESLSDLERKVRGLKERGWTIKAQGLKAQGKAADAPSGTFVAEVIQQLQKAGVSDKTQDDVYQLYLESLPELSMRKHAIHRKAVPGFDPDAIRAFAFNMHHGAHQIARLRYAHKLADTITLLKQQQDQARREDGADTRRIAAGDAILGELDKRHQWIMNPADSKAANLASSFGFVYYLGLTPAAALVNLTQTALISFPHLAARYGAVKAMNRLLAAMKDSAGTLGHAQKKLTNPDEIAAHAELQRMGALDKTQAHNLAGIAEGGLAGYNPKWAKAMSVIGWGFHKTEVINREATGLAAYRLAREAGETHEQAIKSAARAITDTHFDYTAQNRARFMQSGTAKVLLMFRQYSLNMTWHLGRMVWQATKHADPEVRKLARRNLAGVLGMSALFSGTLGLPLMSVTFGVLNAIAASVGDDDDPWDAETEFRAFLDNLLGEGAGAVVANGAANALTGADIASRVSLSQLWFRDADRELDGRGAYYNLLEQAAGPMGGVLKNALVGKQMMDEGHFMRGVETVLPKALKDTLKAQRYAAEGVNNLRGDPLVKDASLQEVLLQLAGFTPDKVAAQYDRNRSLKNYEQHILDRRQALIDGFAMALRNEDDEARTETIERIRKFNSAYPEIAITTKGLRTSIGRRARYSQDAENGIVLNRRLAARVHREVEE